MFKSLQLELTSLCNLRCPLCYTSSPQSKRLPPFFPLSELKRLFTTLPKEVQTVNLYGKVGEPLLHGEIVAIVHWAHQQFPEANLRMSTNGTLLRDYIARGLAASPLNTLFVAVDGATKKTYGKYRIGGDFKQVRKNIKVFNRMKRAAGKKTPRTFLQFIPMAHNISETKNIVQMARDLGCQGVRIKVSGSVERNKKFAAGVDVMKQVREKLDEPGWIVESKTIREGLCQFDELYVDTKGDIYPCCHAAAVYKLSFGNYQENWWANLHEWQVAKRHSSPICQSKCGSKKNKELLTIKFK